ncbi:MAG TPA: hypothetical protein GX693_03785 [Firmicutes bacterium]|nr:hypothetical protein [Bacillota bacterium]
MNIQERVQKSINNLQQGVEELRNAARETENSQASNAFIMSAQKVEDCIQQCRIALNQFR